MTVSNSAEVQGLSLKAMKYFALKLLGLLVLGFSLRETAGNGCGRRDRLPLPLSSFRNGGGNGPPQLPAKCVPVLDEVLLGRRAATHPIQVLRINRNGSVIATEVQFSVLVLVLMKTLLLDSFGYPYVLCCYSGFTSACILHFRCQDWNFHLSFMSLQEILG